MTSGGSRCKEGRRKFPSSLWDVGLAGDRVLKQEMFVSGILPPHSHCAACVQSLSRVQLFETPWTVTRQAPLSTRFSRQEYWSGLPCPSPGGPPHPATRHTSPVSPTWAGGASATEPPGLPPQAPLWLRALTLGHRQPDLQSVHPAVTSNPDLSFLLSVSFYSLNAPTSPSNTSHIQASSLGMSVGSKEKPSYY